MAIDIAALSPEQLEAIRAMHAAGIRTPKQVLNATKVAQLDIVEHVESSFYIPETAKPMVLQPHQKIILRIMAGQHNYPRLLRFYSTVEYSAPKKHGKTATSGAHAKWRAESQTLNDEILFFANDETQSRGRAYQAILFAITLNPLYDEKRRVLLDDDGNVVWRVIEDHLEHVPTGTKVKAVNVDYRGEAGANPSLTVWTECWGYDTSKQELLFDEMTPVLTRTDSQRVLEGYAGYTGKSIVQEKVEALLTNPDKGGRQLTLDDIPDWPWPEDDELPLWVNDDAGIFGYLDRGLATRKRMPWLQGERGEAYYREQQLTLHDPMQYDRLHLNYWISPVDSFIQLEWWKQCADASVGSLEPWRRAKYILECPQPDETLGAEDHLLGLGLPAGSNRLAAYMSPTNWEIVGEPTPVVLAGDASVSGDCTALVGLTRHPVRHADCVLRWAWKWDPPRGSKIDYDTTANSKTGLSFRQTLISMCMQYNVVQFSYDEWQLHHLTNELRRDGIVWCRAFKQGIERDVADKQLYDLIKLKRISWCPGTDESEYCGSDMEKHLAGSSRTMKPKEDTKLHIVKASDDSKIDLVVATSMGSCECLRLDI
jgi:hypothetical protein